MNSPHKAKHETEPTCPERIANDRCENDWHGGGGGS
jgi:hypothetical protein